MMGFMRATETTLELSRLEMPNRNTQILNVTTHGHVKLNQAEKAVAGGFHAWVDPLDPDHTRGFRKLTRDEIAEVWEKRATEEQEKSSPLYKRSEIPGLIFRWPESVTWQTQHAAAQRGIIQAAANAHVLP